VTKKTFKYQDAIIFYRTIGMGKTVVLLHGFAEDGEIWDNQVNFLKNHFRLIIPDLAGSGKSDLVRGANIETYADIIKEIVDIECPDADPVTLIGHSMGGYITLAFAEKYPKLLDSFGLFHSTAFADSEEKKQVREKAIDFINDKGPALFLKTSTPALFTKKFAEKFPEQVEALVERGKKFTAEALVQYYKAMMSRPDRTDVLKTFDKPILFIIGEFDNAIPLQSSLQQCYLPMQSHLNLLERSAHMGMLEEAGKSNQVLLKFLQYAKTVRLQVK
jgi:pimeloyl-ACP methyl ester carboxylesterase